MRPDAQLIMAAQTTISGRIRALAQSGFSRSEIAELVQRSYQQVRQVLVEDERRRTRNDMPVVARAGVQEDSTDFSRPPSGLGLHTQRVQLDESGRLVLPPSLIKTLDARPGEWIIAVSAEDGTVALLSARAAMRQAQAIVRAFAPAGVSLVDELIAERRAEAARENDGA